MDRETLKDIIRIKRDFKKLTLKDFLKAIILIIMFYMIHLMLYAIVY